MERRRGWIVVTVALVLIAALVSRRILRSSVLDNGSHATGARSEASEKGSPPRAPRRRVRPPDLADVSAPTVDEEAQHDAPSLFTPLFVAVRRAEGDWIRGTEGVAYALRPGDTGAAGSVSRASLAEDGTCTLQLPEPGVYDIGAAERGEFNWTLVTDVDTRRDAHVLLTLPPRDEIRFVADPALPPGASSFQTVAIDDGRVPAVTPGRGAVPDRRWIVANDRLPVSIWAPRGLVLRAVQGLDGVRSAPSRFSAPATVSVRADERGSYVLRVNVEPSDRVARHDVVLRPAFEVEGGGVIDRWEDHLGRSWTVPAGRRVSDVVSFTFAQRAPASHVTVRWLGHGIVRGECAVVVPDGQTVDVPVVLRLADTLPGEEEAVVRIDGAESPFEVRCVVLDAEAEPAILDVSAPATDVTVPVPAGPAPHAMIAWSRTRASDPMSFTAGGRHALVLRPAGWLRVSVDALGQTGDVHVRLRRADGMPIPSNERGHTADPMNWGFTWAGDYADLDGSSVTVGPLPEGDIALVVTCAGTTFAAFTAHVVAGKTTLVHVPVRRAAARAQRESPK